MTKTPAKKNDLTRIADALERLSPHSAPPPDLSKAPGYLWQGDSKTFTPIDKINFIPLDSLIGIEPQKQKLLANTIAFATGYPANNALLWGARGMGKSSLIKAVHNEIANTEVNSPTTAPLTLVEVMREDIITLNDCLAILKQEPNNFILFCDDLSFEPNDPSYKSLKALLEGGIMGRPKNVIVYATSNQRHLLTRDQSEYHGTDYIHTTDMTNEKISLSDRFGLWLGFHNCDKQHYDEMVLSYARQFGLKGTHEELIHKAHQWSMERGSRSGRVAWQFIQHLAGEQKIKT